MISRVLLALLALGSFTLALQAQAAKTEISKQVDAILKTNDANSNGTLEWQECFARAMKLEHALRDAGDDAKRIEAANRATPGTLIPETFLASDGNDNLVLTRGELKAWLELPEAKRAGMSAADEVTLFDARWNDAWPLLLKRADLNKDKKLGAAELKSRVPAEVVAAAFTDEAFAGADRDKDGALGQKELIALMQALRKNGRVYMYFGNGWLISSSSTGAETSDDGAGVFGGCEEEFIGDEPDTPDGTQSKPAEDGGSEDRKTKTRTPGLSTRKLAQDTHLLYSQVHGSGSWVNGFRVAGDFERYDITSYDGRVLKYRDRSCFADGDSNPQGAGGGGERSATYFSERGGIKFTRGIFEVAGEKFESLTYGEKDGVTCTLILIDGCQLVAERKDAKGESLEKLIGFPQAPDQPKDYKVVPAPKTGAADPASEGKVGLKLLYSMAEDGVEQGGTTMDSDFSCLKLGAARRGIVEFTKLGKDRAAVRIRPCDETLHSLSDGWKYIASFEAGQFSKVALLLHQRVSKTEEIEIAGRHLAAFNVNFADGSVAQVAVIGGFEIPCKLTDASGKVTQELIGFLEEAATTEKK